MFKELFEKINKNWIQDIENFPEFADALMMYLMYNDKDSALELSKMDLNTLFSKPKKLYRIIRAQSPSDFDMNRYGITSASTEVLDKDIMKDTINQYTTKGNFYQQQIIKAQGIDIMDLKKSLQGQKRALMKLYDTPGNEPVSALYDALGLEQKEFIIFGDYVVQSTKEI